MDESILKIDLPASKSIHNRLLILNELYGLNLQINNPSNSGDSVLLKKLLNEESDTIDCQNAGTVFRFLTALFSVKDKTITLTGSARMQQRPISDLVIALQSLGAKISYKNNTGLPPIIIFGGLKNGGSVTISGETSSQFISALTMIGPYLNGGLTIEIEGKISSKPYIEMTVKLMKNLGFDIEFTANQIITKPWNKKLLIKTVNIEPDWSAVAFWFQIISISKGKKVCLNGLKSTSVQGDSILAKWAGMLGIKITENDEGILLEKSEIPVMNNTEWDLSNYPDLAPSIIVLLSALKRNATFTGLDSLKIKESNRTLALQTELIKCGVELIEKENSWVLNANNFELKENTQFENYDDHRIAMAFGCLSLIKPIRMENRETVNKSYPDFWEHLDKFTV